VQSRAAFRATSYLEAAFWDPLRLAECYSRVGDASMEKSKDQDRSKGAMEQDQQNQGGNTSMQGQLGHRDEDIELKDADSNLAG
jgi:hypothetical protein